jgi:hypothetical protein
MSDHPTTVTEQRNAEAEAVADKFEGWQGWYAIGAHSSTPYHARIVGAIPPVMVHGEDPEDLRDEIIKCIRRREMAAGL